ncbi:HNH endonuclease [Burkholderia gladioli]|uniref:HNH endonuclease n=1 Tax=Burkholderia gladioli TaxID=28095 RepID=UPI001FC817D1|nr:HNH endonuclease [Burkholderia gladioli]
MSDDISISRFFERIGVRLHNARWSWGAQRDQVIVLRTWEDQCLVRERRVAVLHQRTLMESASAGLDERVQHLKAIWQGGIAAYTVIAAAVDPTPSERTIKSYRDALFAIDKLEVDADGTFYARYSRVLTPAEFKIDAATHQTVQGEGRFPVDIQMESGLSSATVREKLPLMREWLIGVARTRAPVQYVEVMRRFDLWYGTLFTSLKRLGQACVTSGEPVITALVVDKDTGRCSKGLKDVFGIEDDEAERRRCYAYWSTQDADVAASGSSAESDQPVTSFPDAGRDLTRDDEERVARFMSVEVRPQQAAFRRAVFVAYGGKCAISGCDVPEALEAAHLHGRDWRDGHNQASDGVLLRRDLHGLYDQGLLDLSDGIVRFDARVLHHYGHFEYLKVSAPC